MDEDPKEVRWELELGALARAYLGYLERRESYMKGLEEPVL